MTQSTSSEMTAEKRNHMLVGQWFYLGIGLGVLFWLFSAMLHTFVFKHGSHPVLWNELFSTSPHQMFVRGFALLFFAGFGMFAQFTSWRQRKANAQIAAERNFNDTLIKSLPGVFYLFDSNMRFQRWNENFQTVTGYSAAELSQMTPLDLFEKEEGARVAERIGEVFTKGISNVEASFLSKDGSMKPYYLTGYKIDIDGTHFLIGVGIDISDRKKMELERERMIYELGERIKEQRCMYAISEAAKSADTIEALFGKTIYAIREGWQYESVTRARIVFDGIPYQIESFEPTPDRIAFDIIIDDEKRGEIEVFYIEKRPDHDVGPFLNEEIALLKGITSTISGAVKKYLFERELKARQNIAESFLGTRCETRLFKGPSSPFESHRQSIRHVRLRG